MGLRPDAPRVIFNLHGRRLIDLVDRPLSRRRQWHDRIHGGSPVGLIHARGRVSKLGLLILTTAAQHWRYVVSCDAWNLSAGP
jgi:hypothetical protein